LKRQHLIQITISLASILLLAVAAFAQTPKLESWTATRHQIPRYEKFEVTVGQVHATFDNPFNTEKVRIHGLFTSPDGREWDIIGFFDGKNFRIRFAPDKVGTWHYRLRIEDVNGASETKGDQFTCTPSTHHGRIRISPYDPRFLSFSDSSGFVGTGQCLPWYLERYPQFWNLMTANKCNLFVYWLPAWDHSLLLASNYDQYNTFSARQIDAIVEKCEENDIYIIFTIWNHDWLRDESHPWKKENSWEKNPFRLLTPHAKDFFTSPDSWTFQKEYYQYIISRWGYSRAIALWQTISEIDGTNAGEHADSWLAKMNEFFRENDPFQHPTTASKSGDKYWKKGFVETDLPQIHAYSARNNIYLIAKDIARFTRQMWDQTNKPNFIGEFGHAANDELQPAHLHNAIWAALANGAAIMPLDWNDGDAWPYMTVDMYAQLKYLAQFVSHFDVQKLGLRPMILKKIPGVDAWGMMGDNAGFAWLLKPSEDMAVAGQKMTVFTDSDSKYSVHWFNTWNGEFTQNEIYHATEHALTITLPDFERDIAFFISKLRKDFQFEDFSGGLYGWEILHPQWEIVQESLQGKAQNDSAAMICSGGTDWRHYALKVKIKIAPNSMGELVVREHNCTGYYAQFSQNQITLAKVGNEERTDLAESAITLTTDKWHSLRFEVMDDMLQVILDGETVLRTKDASFEQGGIGLLVDHGTVWFDDIEIERDTTPPPAPTIDPLPKMTDRDKILINGEKTNDADTIKIVNNGTAFAEIVNDTTWRAQVNLAHFGVNKIDIFSSDKSGNVSDTLTTFISRYTGDLLLYDDFSSFDRSVWKTVAGKWTARDGLAKVAGAPGLSFFITGKDYWQNYSASFRALMPKPGTVYLPFYWQNEKNHDRVRLRFDETGRVRVALERILDGTTAKISEAEIPLNIANTRDWFSCLLQVNGENFTVFIDGMQVLQADDNAFSSGKTGVGSYRSGAQFADFTVFREKESAVEKEETTETTYDLEQNYPNPFNPTTRIRFTIPQKSHVTLKIFNILGKNVATLVDEPLTEGQYEYQWDGLDAAGNQISAGVYFYELHADQFLAMRKMIFAK